jgi:hypothetical protein
MTPKVSQYINKTILVSIPVLFDDGRCRPFKLIGVEISGLWLQAHDLAERLLPEAMRNYSTAEPVVFVPFAQIGGVVIPTRPPTAAPIASATKETKETKETNDKPARAKPSTSTKS